MVESLFAVCHLWSAVSSAGDCFVAPAAPMNPTPICHCERSEAISFSGRGLLRRCAPRNDMVERLRAKRLSRAERGESNLLVLIVIASEAKQSPNQHGDCFVAALLAMTW